MVAASETTILDVGTNGGIEAVASDDLGKLVPTDVPQSFDDCLREADFNEAALRQTLSRAGVNGVCEGLRLGY